MARKKTSRQVATQSVAVKAHPGVGARPRRSAGAFLNPLKFLGQVRQEARKVTWTSRNETLVSTIMVIIMSLFAFVFFFLVDTGIGWIIQFLLGLGA